MSLDLQDRKCFFYIEQDQRPTETPTFEVKSMKGREQLSSLFEFQLELVSTRDDLNAGEIVGSGGLLEMPLRDGDRRYFHGVVAMLERRGSTGDEDTIQFAYHAVLVPWFWTLQLTHDCRTFENKTVVQIADEIFGKYSYGDYEFPKDYQGETMDYCVQYRESDFAFLSRLFEQWGLGYTFKHDEQKHQLVIFEESASLPEVIGDDLEVRFEGGEEGGASAGEVSELIDRQDMPPAYYEIDDYRFKDPEYDYKSWDWATQGTTVIHHEIFDYPGGYVTEIEEKTADRGTMFARFRRESTEAYSRRLEGRGISTGFTAGLHFVLNMETNLGFEDGARLLLTEVVHEIEQGVGSESEPTIYSNSFACLPEDVPYRPRQATRKPTIVGTQSAVVVGPNAGVENEPEEIHTDKYGRVRLKFHWNRHVSTERPDLCWARVQQSLAGHKWGTQFIPRVGQEVVVSFLEGDPDRPVVIGALYNGKRMPAFDLPANKTQSGWKTRSSKEGNDQNYNEIKFEDKKGDEQIAIHAEKNMNTSVEADSSLSVGGKRSETIDKGQTTTVKEGGSEFTVEAGGCGNTITGLTYFGITGAMETYAQDGISMDGTTGDTCPAVPQVMMNSEMIKLEMGSSKITADPGQILLQVGGSSVTIVDGTITVAADQVEVTGNTVVVNGDGGNVTVTGDVEMNGGNITATADSIKLNS